MAIWTWQARNKAGQLGGRQTVIDGIETVEDITAYLKLHFPNVEVLNVKKVEDQPKFEPGVAGGERVVPVTFHPIPPSDYQHGIIDEVKKELAAKK